MGENSSDNLVPEY